MPVWIARNDTEDSYYLLFHSGQKPFLEDGGGEWMSYGDGGEDPWPIPPHIAHRILSVRLKPGECRQVKGRIKFDLEPELKKYGFVTWPGCEKWHQESDRPWALCGRPIGLYATHATVLPKAYIQQVCRSCERIAKKKV